MAERDAARARMFFALALLPALGYAAIVHAELWLLTGTASRAALWAATGAFWLLYAATAFWVALRRPDWGRAALLLMPFGPGVGVALAMMSVGPVWHLSFDQALPSVAACAGPLILAAPLITMLAGGAHALAARRRGEAPSDAARLP